MHEFVCDGFGSVVIQYLLPSLHALFKYLVQSFKCEVIGFRVSGEVTQDGVNSWMEDVEQHEQVGLGLLGDLSAVVHQSLNERGLKLRCEGL